MYNRLRGRAQIAVLVTGLILSGTVMAYVAVTVRTVDRLTVWSSGGKPVGPLLNTDPPRIVLKVEGLPAVLGVSHNSFSGSPLTPEVGLLYESADCSGQPFTDSLPDPSDLVQRTYLTGMDGTQGRAIMIQDGAPRTVVAQSGSNGIGSNNGCYPTNLSFIGQPLRFAADLHARFPPPFEVRE